MDPGSLAILMRALIPILAVLFVFGMPVCMFFISKNHKLRMRELELEAQHMAPGLDVRLQAIEERLANIEVAITGSAQPALPSTQERAALLEGPPRLRTP
jgi:hypothetical protein